MTKKVTAAFSIDSESLPRQQCTVSGLSTVEGEHNQHLMFFQNLLDAEKRKERQKLYNRFVKQMTGLKL